MTEHDEIVRGEEARQLLENPLLKGAFSAVREGIVKALETSAMGDEKTHNRLTIALQLLGQVEKQIKDHVTTGKMAAIQSDDRIGQKLRMIAGI